MDPERYWAKVDVRGPEECWPWTAATTDRGYGNFWNGLRAVGAHRVAFELAFGTFDPALDVLHTCDNPPCQNPHHLFLGTESDNMQDAIIKGRWTPVSPVYGVQNGSAKVTRPIVATIRRIYAEGGITQRALGRRFGLSHQEVSRITRREVWQ